MDLTDIRMNDGSRNFICFPEDAAWTTMRDYIAALPGAVVTEYLTDGIVEVWIDFDYRAYSFTIHNYFAEYYFFANDPRCPEEILQEVAAYCAPLLGVSESS